MNFTRRATKPQKRAMSKQNLPPKHFANAFSVALLFALWSLASSPCLAAGYDSTLFEGVLQPNRQVDVAASEFGILREMLVKPGTHVKAGDLIARLDSQDLQSQLEIARAESEAGGRLGQIQGELILHENRLRILSELAAKGKANQREVDRALADLEITEAKMRSEHESTEVLSLQVERLERLISERSIRSPIDAIVVEVHKQVGEFVAANAPSVVRLHDVSMLKATFPMTESDIRELGTRESMQVKLSDGQTVTGRVDFIPPVADPESGWFMVTILIDNPDGSIRCSRCTRLK